jgi:hypothetical protein
VIHLLKHISELGPGLSFSAFPYVWSITPSI